MGCLLFEMLTGRLPYSGATPLEVVFKHVHEPIPTPSRVLPSAKISPEVDAAVRGAMAKDRERRFGSAQAFLDALPDARALPGGERAYVTHPELMRRPGTVARWKQRVLFAALVAVGGLTTELSWRTTFQQRAARQGLRPVAPAPPVAPPLLLPTTAVTPLPPTLDASLPPRGIVLLVTPPDATLTVDAASSERAPTPAALNAAASTPWAQRPRGSSRAPRPSPSWTDNTLRWSLLRAAPRPLARPQRPPRPDAGTTPLVGPEGLKQSPYGAPAR